MKKTQRLWTPEQDLYLVAHSTHSQMVDLEQELGTQSLASTGERDSSAFREVERWQHRR